MPPTTLLQFILQDLSHANYTRKLDTLLYLEEVNAEVDIRKFDIEQVNVVFTKAVVMCISSHVYSPLVCKIR